MDNDTPADALTSTPDKAAIRKMITQYGGGFHGPNVEHLSMEEQAFWRLMDEILTKQPAQQPGQAVDVDTKRQAMDAIGCRSSLNSNFDHLYNSGAEDMFDHLARLGLIAPPARDGSSEPVAWVGKVGLESLKQGGDCIYVWAKKSGSRTEPLYAHPAPSPAPGDTDRATMLEQRFRSRIQTALSEFIGKTKYKTVADAQKAIVDFICKYLHIGDAYDYFGRALSTPAAPVVPDKSPDLANNETCAPNSTNDALMAMVRELVEARKKATFGYWKTDNEKGVWSEELGEVVEKTTSQPDASFIALAANIATRMAQHLDKPADGIDVVTRQDDRVALARAVVSLSATRHHEAGCVCVVCEENAETLATATRILGEQP